MCSSGRLAWKEAGCASLHWCHAALPSTRAPLFIWQALHWESRKNCRHFPERLQFLKSQCHQCAHTITGPQHFTLGLAWAPFLFLLLFVHCVSTRTRSSWLNCHRCFLRHPHTQSEVHSPQGLSLGFSSSFTGTVLHKCLPNCMHRHLALCERKWKYEKAARYPVVHHRQLQYKQSNCAWLECAQPCATPWASASRNQNASWPVPFVDYYIHPPCASCTPLHSVCLWTLNARGSMYRLVKCSKGIKLFCSHKVAPEPMNSLLKYKTTLNFNLEKHYNGTKLLQNQIIILFYHCYCCWKCTNAPESIEGWCGY